MKGIKQKRGGSPSLSSPSPLFNYFSFCTHELLLAHPILMERPIVVRCERAVVARRPERVWELVEKS